MSNPDWLTSRVLAEAAIATATARQTATELHEQGREHFDDPTWRDRVADVHRTCDKAEEIGISRQDVLDASKAR